MVGNSGWNAVLEFAIPDFFMCIGSFLVPAFVSATCRTHTICQSLCRYQRSGTVGPPVLLVHGFGGNCDHWRKNTGVVGEWGRAYSIDLLGYGYSDKPNPRPNGGDPNTVYNFQEWGSTSPSPPYCS